jgi:outer membrane immunogenic protein
LSYSGIEGEGSGPAGDTCWGIPWTCKVELTWFGTARARLGYAWSRHLLYVTGGAAFGSLKGTEGDFIAPGFGGSRDGAGSGSKTRFGWTIGGGVETRINDRWSTKFEYLYVDLGKGNVFNDVSIFGNLPQDVAFTTHVFRTGINYSFSTGGSPVPASY